MAKKKKKDSLKELRELAEKLIVRREKLERAKEKAAKIETKTRRLSERIIPDKMMECGVSEFKLSDGTVISIKSTTYANLSAKHREEGIKWLRANGYGELIKEEVIVKLQGEVSEKFKNALIKRVRKEGLEFVDQETIHAQTLSALVREKLASSESTGIPLDTLGVYTKTETKVQLKKGRK